MCEQTWFDFYFRVNNFTLDSVFIDVPTVGKFIYKIVFSSEDSFARSYFRSYLLLDGRPLNSDMLLYFFRHGLSVWNLWQT